MRSHGSRTCFCPWKSICSIVRKEITSWKIQEIAFPTERHLKKSLLVTEGEKNNQQWASSHASPCFSAERWEACGENMSPGDLFSWNKRVQKIGWKNRISVPWVLASQQGLFFKTYLEWWGTPYSNSVGSMSFISFPVILVPCSNKNWLLVEPYPSGKIWVHHLGYDWYDSQLFLEIHKIHVPVTTNQSSFWWLLVPSGERTHNYRKSHFFDGTPHCVYGHFQ